MFFCYISKQTYIFFLFLHILFAIHYSGDVGVDFSKCFRGFLFIVGIEISIFII